MITATGLTVPGRISDVDLTLSAGELVVLAGESGAGKTTLARSLFGLEPLAEGSVLYGGRELIGAPEAGLRPLRGRELAMLFQSAAASLSPAMRIGAQLAEQRRAHGLAADTATVAADLERCGLAPAHARAYPHQLSGGMAQRAALALALALEPLVLIADEPTTGLDPASRELVLERLAEAAARGAAVLVVTHDVDAVAPMADRVLGMVDGRLGSAPPLFAEPPPALRHAVPPADPLLSIDRLRFGYSASEPVLRGASLAVGQGETLALTGPSGCGKTTLARCALRLLSPDSGSVRFDGAELVGLSDRRLRPLRPGLQMVFQDPLASLNPRRRVGRVLGPRAAELLDAVGLSRDFLGRLPAELSGGERQRVAIARALAPDPRLIVLDEPTSSLDRASEDHILDLLAGLRDERGLSFLLIAHDARVVEKLADRACVMAEGAIQGDRLHEPVG